VLESGSRAIELEGAILRQRIGECSSKSELDRMRGKKIERERERDSMME